MKKILFGIFLLSLLLVNVNIVSAEKKISPAGVKYDSEILEGNEWCEGFDEGAEWVPVTIKIKDLSGVSFLKNDTKETHDLKWLEKTTFSEGITNIILNELKDDKFILNEIAYAKNGFDGKITQKGFEKLIGNSRLLYIYIRKGR